mgnify:CR=1 FL=1
MKKLSKLPQSELLAALATLPDAPFEFTHFVRFVGTEKDPAIVLGKSGTFTMLMEWRGYGNQFQMWQHFDIIGVWVIVHGTGDLANLHGQGLCWHTRTGVAAFEYKGLVHFSP